MEDFAELMQRLLEIQSGGRKRSPELIAEDTRAEMALFLECMPKCGRKVLDTADIVRDAMFRQLAEIGRR